MHSKEFCALMGEFVYPMFELRTDSCENSYHPD